MISRICDLYAAYDNARVIAVVGARGGVGASTVAQNVAWSIAERQHASTALVDLELSFGVAGFDFEERGAQSMGVGFLAPDIVDYTATRGLYEPYRDFSGGNEVGNWADLLGQLGDETALVRLASHAELLATTHHRYHDGRNTERVYGELLTRLGGQA